MKPKNISDITILLQFFVCNYVAKVFIWAVIVQTYNKSNIHIKLVLNLLITLDKQYEHNMSINSLLKKMLKLL